MKTAESWLEEMFSRGNWVVADVITLKAIQRDALLAASEISQANHVPACNCDVCAYRKRILERSREI